LEGVALKDMTLVGGIRLKYKGFKADSLMPVVFAKKVIEKYLEKTLQTVISVPLLISFLCENN
jgi:hypothetical protein